MSGKELYELFWSASNTNGVDIDDFNFLDEKERAIWETFAETLSIDYGLGSGV